MWPSSTSRRRRGAPFAYLGVLDHAPFRGPFYRTEMDHVPGAPPRDHRSDAEGMDLSGLLVDDPRIGDLVVADPVVTRSGRHPVGVLLRDDDLDQAGRSWIGTQDL